MVNVMELWKYSNELMLFSLQETHTNIYEQQTMLDVLDDMKISYNVSILS